MGNEKSDEPYQSGLNVAVGAPTRNAGIPEGDNFGSENNGNVASDADYAELKRLAAEQTRAITARDAFLAVAAYELRNPMTPILGKVQLLRRSLSREGFEREKIDVGLEQIEWLVQRYIRRATTLLDIAKMTTGDIHLQPVDVDIRDLTRTVADSLSPMLGQSGSTLVFDMPPQAVVGNWDPFAVEQILDNLISNAIKYGEGLPIRVVVSRKGNEVVLRVSDNGCGISAQDQERIFERFDPARMSGGVHAGFGLGLWLARQLANAMGGAIDVASGVGQGSVFTLVLPSRSMALET